MESKKPHEELLFENEALRLRLQEAEETLRAIRNHEVDALMAEGPGGDQVFTLQGAEHPYRVLVETMNEAALTMTPDGMLLYCNNQLSELLQLPLNKIMGVCFYDFLVSRDHEQSFKAMLQACGIEGCKKEFLLKSAGGPEVPVLLSARSLMLNDVEAFCIVATDLTEQKRTERELRESEMRYRRLVETAEEGIWAADLDKKTTFVNAKVAQMLGYTVDELIGQDFTRFLVEEDASAEQEHMEQWRKGVRSHHDARFRRKDGEIVSCRLSVCPITDNQGTRRGGFAMLTDVTEQMRLEEQLRQAQKMEAIGTLAGGIAHDFNNILAAIIGFTELSIDDAPEGTLIERNMKNVLKAGIRGRDLVKQILAFSRKAGYQRKPLPLTPLLKETFNLLRASLPTTIEMALNVKTSADVVLADATQMQQVLMNLCTNAADAMRAAGGRLEIGLTDTLFTEDGPLPGSDMRPGTYVTVTVSDTGLGMDEAVQKRVFEPFFTTKETGKGTGLGLAVVYGIVNAHQGAITVSSKPGLGSTFTVYLPRYTSGEKAEPMTGRPISRGTERVLFVDDDEALVELAEGLLQGLGYQVTGTADSVDALRAFSESPDAFDLVMTDQTMPRMTGAILAQKIKEIRPDIPIILCTGYSEAVDPDEAESMGIQAFVMKPLVKREIAEAIRRVLDSKAGA